MFINPAAIEGSKVVVSTIRRPLDILVIKKRLYKLLIELREMLYVPVHPIYHGKYCELDAIIIGPICRGWGRERVKDSMVIDLLKRHKVPGELVETIYHQVNVVTPEKPKRKFYY